jgi:hypothetical protein
MKFKDAVKRAVDMFENDREFLERIKIEDPTMVKQLPILKQINQLGFLTTESQAGLRKKGKSSIDGKDYEIHEKAYVCGFMQEKEAGEFIKKMALHTDKNAIFVPTCCDDVIIPRNLDIPLTTSKQNGKISVDTHMSMAIPQSAENMFRKWVKLNKTEKAVYIYCWDPEWNRLASGKNGLFRDVLKCLQ